ncbi:MAG: penicillin-binding protein 2 [Bacteroidales bacterium]
MAKRNLSNRRHIIFRIFLIVAAILLVRLFFLQVLDNEYKLSAENNAIRHVTLYPLRGMIYDRDNKLMVYNEPAYDLMIIPRKVKIEDTLEFCNFLSIEKEDFIKRMKRCKGYSYSIPSIFLGQLSREDYGFLAENLYKYPGFYVQSRTLRKYPFPIAAHTFGYIGEVNDRETERDSYYRSGDYIGKSGLEKFYEKDLRGRKGKKIMLVDVFRREKGSYKNGKYDTIPIHGKDLTISLDADLQSYAEQLMQNKKGSIVAIEPGSGEILAFVTSPTYDPNLLVGRVRGKNYGLLQNDSLNPLMNRAVLGAYSPGSTFKMITGLIGLQEGVVNSYTKFYCEGREARPIRCSHYHESPINIMGGIQQSCNPFFWQTFKRCMEDKKFGNIKDAYKNWYNHVRSFGLGEKFNTDIPFEVSGKVPKMEYFDKIYRGRWNALTVRSLSIGQGELLVTPLQLANLAAIFGNKGYYYAPHFIREKDHKWDDTYGKKIYTTIDSVYYNVVREGMLEVFEGAHGTARFYKVPGVVAAGKTGTVENNHGKDHSVFLSFAPYNKPKIAISVIVENGGFGTKWAAPIASLLTEKYINDTIKRPALEKRIMEGDLIHPKEKIIKQIKKNKLETR